MTRVELISKEEDLDREKKNLDLVQDQATQLKQGRSYHMGFIDGVGREITISK